MHHVAADPSVVSPSAASSSSAEPSSDIALPVGAWIDVPTGVRLNYVEQGRPDGVPILLLHGLSDSLHSYAHVLPELPASVRAFALSQRGHGDSSRPTTGYRPRDFAADLAAFLDAFGIERAVVAGHSMSSGIALRFAIDYPERTLGLVPMGAFAYVAGHPAWDGLAEAIAGLADPIDRGFVREFQESTLAQPVPPAYLDLVVQESLKLPLRVWRAVVDDFSANDHRDRLASIQAPTLLVWGDRDTYFPRADQDALLARIAGARLLVYEGAGHALHWEEPARFAADLVAFAESLM